MSDLLDKIFLGNVNEKGELDQEGYDQETKTGLTKAVREDKGSIVGNVVTADDTKVAEDDGTIPKAPEAIDYSREQEAIDDEEDKANDIYAEKAKRMLEQHLQKQAAPSAARKTDDDYDEYDEEEEAEPAAAPAPAPAASQQPPTGAGVSQATTSGKEPGKEAVVPSPGAAPAAPKSAQKKAVEAVQQNVRRNGLLCFSDMIIAPPTTTSRMFSRRKHTNINVKVEYMSDEEDKFVDEAARRAAAAAALRLREQHEAGGGEEGKEAEDEEDEEEEEEKKFGGSFSRQASADLGDVAGAGAALGPAVSVGEAGAAALEEGAAAAAAAAGDASRVAAAASQKVKVELPAWEACNWEQDIVWGDSSEGEGGDEGGEEPDVGGKGGGGDDDDEFDEDEFEAELDMDGEDDDVLMRDHFGGGGAGGGMGGSGAGGGGSSGSKRRGGGSRRGDGGQGEDEEDEEKRRKIILERVLDAKRYFLERENMPHQNAVRIGEYNEALEHGAWVSHIIWNDQDRKNSRLALAARRASGGRCLTLRRPIKGKDSGSILGKEILAPHSYGDRVHACIPPWWSRRGPDLQARHVPLLDELAERLDLSHDAYYQEVGGTKARIKLQRPSVLHAPVTRHLRQRPVKSSTLQDSYRTDFHRNRVFRDPKATYSIHFTPQDNLDGEGAAGGRESKERKDVTGAQEKIQALKKMSDVTVKDSKNMLLEHLEEAPPLMSNSGMASRIRHYYRSKSDQPAPTIPADVLADGKAVGLDPQQESPFFDDLPEGQAVSALENNMLRHPIAKHQAAETDFLVVCKNDKYYLRPINSLYVAGQCHPFLKVPKPNDKEVQAYQRRHLINFIYGRLKKNRSLQTHEVFDEFPATSETAIRKQLKDCAQFNREGGDGGHWTLKPDYKPPDDALDEADTPDMVCLHESLQAGHMRLRNMGVKSLNKGDEVTAAVTEISKDAKIDPIIRHGALCVQELLWRAPWNQSSNFVSSTEHRDKQPLNLSTVAGSRKAEETARRDELMGGAAARADVKEVKKAAAEYAKRKQAIFLEMLESMTQNEADASSEGEGDDETVFHDEDSGGLAAGGFSRGMRRVLKKTIAHRWRREIGTNLERWVCETITNAEEVAKIVSDKKRKNENVEEPGDERAKADARREKKRLQEQKRRKMKKMQKMGVATDSSMFLDDDEEPSRRPEKAGVIKISSEAVQHMKTQKKRSARELPDHLQAKGRRRIQRRRLDPKSELNNIFEKAVQAMWTDDKSVPFRSAVDSRSNPRYRAIIKTPIDLNIIKTRLSEACYNSKKQLMADVQLMADNCRTYNEASNHTLVSDVMALVQTCEAKLEEGRNTILEAESMIKLAERLEDVTRKLMIPKFEAFHNTVTSKNYTTVIKRPMSLKEMQDKATNFAYSARHGFLEDLRLIRDNCHTFCGDKFPNMPPLADELLALGEELIQQQSEAFATLEARVGTWAHHNSKLATPGTSYPGTPGLGRSVPGSPGGGGGEVAQSPALAAAGGDGGVEDEMEDELANAMEEEDNEMQDELENAMEEDFSGADDELAEGMHAPAGGDF